MTLLFALSLVVVGGAVVAYVVHIYTRSDWVPPTADLGSRPTGYPRITPPSRPAPPSQTYTRNLPPARPSRPSIPPPAPAASTGLDAIDVLILHDVMSHHHDHHDCSSDSDVGSFDGGDCGSD